MESRLRFRKRFDDLPPNIFEYIVEFLLSDACEVFKLRCLNGKNRQRVHNFWKNKYNRLVVEISILKDHPQERGAPEEREMFEELVEQLDKAEENLVTLTRQDLTELKSYSKPYPDVARAISLAAILLKVVKSPEDLQWKNLKLNLLIKSPGINARLQKFDRNDISAKTIQKVNKYIDKEGLYLSYDYLALTSVAAAKVYLWAERTLAYHKISRQVGKLPLSELRKSVRGQGRLLRHIKNWSQQLNFSLQ
mmetsp:Transcript_42753/g.49141  ORF Transcript_42753/g.49141 Transcript_42753/m.49141 type:complete len:250 (-) Transcript_42753:149-898(-)